jgi:hypothetical protein
MEAGSAANEMCLKYETETHEYVTRVFVTLGSLVFCCTKTSAC